MPTTKATKEAAQAIGVSVGTMRNWSDQYAAFLSESARPGYLPERRFTEKDLTILAYIKQLRGEGMQVEQIRQRLSETTFQDVEIIQQQATTDGDKLQQITPEAAADTRQGQETGILAIQVFDAINAQNRKIEALERSAIEAKQEQRAAWWYIALGILIGLGLAAIFEMAAIVASRH